MEAIYDLLESAVAKSAEKDAELVRDRFDRLRRALDVYEKTSKENSQRRAIEKMLSAIAIPVPETSLASDAVHQASETELKEALRAVLDSLAEDPVVKVEAPAPSVVKPPPLNGHAQVVLDASEKEIDEVLEKAVRVAPPVAPELIVSANRLLADIKAMAASDLEKLPEGRVTAQLQLFAAQGREILTKLPRSNPLFDSILNSFRTILDMKDRRGITGYISGLSRGATGNWARIAAVARKQVEQYDQVTTAPPSSKRKEKPVKEKPPIENPTDLPYPYIARMSQTTEIMLVGGLRIPERVELLKSQGINCEWYEIQKDNPRAAQSVVQRIQNKKAGAVVILQYFMSHSTFESLKAVCNAVKMPFALADKGGKGALDLALRSLELKLQS